MSHLLKKNKSILISIRIFFLFLISFLFLKTMVAYSGNRLIYFLFSLISIYMIFFSFRKKSFFYENFFGVFLLLGFWLKFSIIYTYNLSFREGLKNNLIDVILTKNYDDALLASSIGIFGFITYGHIREYFFNYPQKIDVKINIELYKKYRTFILISFFCLIVGVCFSNFFLQIYQRGSVGQSYNFIISGFIKTSLLYSLTLCSAIILYCDLASYKKVFLIIILLIFFETFLSSVSMLSRGMIFNSSALLFALYKLSNKTNLNISFVTFLKFFIILLITFYISVITVNSLRINKEDGPKPQEQQVFKFSNETVPSVDKLNMSKKPVLEDEKLKVILIKHDALNRDLKDIIHLDKKLYSDLFEYFREDMPYGTNKRDRWDDWIVDKLIKSGLISNELAERSSEKEFNIIAITKFFFDQSFYRFYYLSIFRWVGIDAMILVTKNKKQLGLDLFKESLKEKFDENSISFYEKNFGIYSEDLVSNNKLLKGNTLPGLIAFLFFSGSYVFLYVAMILFCFVASTLEYLMFRVTFNNLLASGLIGMVVAYRFAHFGYLPARSYLLFGSIIIIILLMYVIKFLNNFYQNQKK